MGKEKESSQLDKSVAAVLAFFGTRIKSEMRGDFEQSVRQTLTEIPMVESEAVIFFQNLEDYQPLSPAKPIGGEPEVEFGRHARPKNRGRRLGDQGLL